MRLKVVDFELTEQAEPIWGTERYDGLRLLVRYHWHPVGWAYLHGPFEPVVPVDRLHKAVLDQLGWELVLRVLGSRLDEDHVRRENPRPISLPISVVDLDRARGPFRLAVPAPGSEYVFNLSGQAIGLDGLLCLMDASGPCGNAVKDAQRTKTGEGTRRTLSVLWGSTVLAGRAEEAAAWYHRLLQAHGASVHPVRCI